MDLKPRHLERLYRNLRFIRRTEEEIARIYPSDKIKSPIHLSIGQEAVAVGVCDALRDDDVVSATYRGHAAYLAKGGDLKAMMAELYGKVTGCGRGKAGSMHLISMDKYILGASAVVGTTLPIAVGYALALKREGTGRVAAAFFGDGATEEGVFYESLNFAALHRLPILFVCENNQYAIHTPIEKRWANHDLLPRVEAFGIPARRVDDGDVIAIRGSVIEAIAPMRDGTAGPALIECMIYRWREHVGPNDDYDAGYRSRDELAPWLENDQVARVAGMIDAESRRRIDDDIEREIAEAVSFAEDSPFPPTIELDTDIYAD